nr:reverse transcriptase domain-containing protein [Tanacetum cinerariifolium]
MNPIYRDNKVLGSLLCVLLLSTTKEKARRERSKSKGKGSKHQEISSDSEYEEGSRDAYEDLNSPYKTPKPTPFTQRITRFKYYRTVKLPQNIRVYEGNKDPKDHLARNLEEFSQQKRYAKDSTEIHGIKRRQNEGLQAFMDRFKSESLHIKGVPLDLRISAFMHGHGHSKLANKLNDNIPKTVDEMFKRVRAFIRGEVAARSAEMVRPSQSDKGYIRSAWSGVPEKAKNRGGPREARRNMGVYTPYLIKDTFTPLIKTPKKILVMESVSFPEPPPLIGTPEDVASRKLAHLVKDISWNNQRNEDHGRNGMKVINMIREEENRKRPFEEGRSGLMSELAFPEIP